jgi:hypothetical protein
MKKNRAEIVEAIRLAWDSLLSHLEYAADTSGAKCDKCGDAKFDRRCVREYAQIIKVLSDQL